MTPEEVAAQELAKQTQNDAATQPIVMENNPNPDLTLATDPQQQPDPMGIGAATAPGAEGALDAPNAPMLGEPQPIPDVPAEPFQGTTTSDTQMQAVSPANIPGKDVRAKIVNYAMQFLGTPYVWGGESPNGFDCSGLVQYVFRHFGYDLPRVSYQQAARGTIVPLNQLMPGDLVAWDENPHQPGADHIAIYAGNGYVIEAPHTGADVRYRKLSKNEGAYGVEMSF